MCEKADVGIAIYIVYDKDMKTKRKKLFWMKDWFEKNNTIPHHNIHDEL